MATDPTRRSGDDDIPPPKHGDGDKAAGVGADEADAVLRVAIEKLKEKQHDLNARQVYDELQKQDPAKWADLTIASVRRVCSKISKGAAVITQKAAAARAQSEAAAAAANAEVCNA